MKLHYMGKYNMDPASLPAGEHKPGAVQFREAENSTKLAWIANGISLVVLVALAVPAVLLRGPELGAHLLQVLLGLYASLLTLFPHELLHAICFRGDVYMYTNLKQGMMFVVGPEDMSRRRFVWMSLLPSIVFGLVPYVLGLVVPGRTFLLAFGLCCTSMGAGDYYNVYNALTQMPRGARTYMHGFHSYWYIESK